MQEQVAIGSVKNVFHTSNLIKTVQNCVRTCQYHKYSSTTGNNSTLVSKIVCMHTYWKPFSMNSEVREARTLPGVTFCSVNGAALLRFVFPQIPWNFGYLFFKREKESFAPNGCAQICTGSFVVTKLWYGMRGAVSTWSVFLLLLKFILHVALYLPVMTFLHHYSNDELDAFSCLYFNN